ncbi:hypothetical protein PV08_00009 [Exophiala spinifera]|uniref:Cytochrome P450 n=1 Tax=Exophiala spinifera TaxID=91928 RepID=A0A0D2A3G9_9EURO|nr:uncharacterized protein PV08_00009 [Exophiala spinifera]KIW19437.1 hypothetical protein PV08_00009 [Exophiala spinifera]
MAVQDYIDCNSSVSIPAAKQEAQTMLHLIGIPGLAILLIFAYVRAHENKWPDGPKGVPLLGVLPDKSRHLHHQLADLVPRYGDFFSFNMGRSKAIILSSPETIEDLIVKRGGKYSSRPSSSPTARIVAQGRLGQMTYGDEFRKHRRVVHGLLGMQNNKIFLPYQEFSASVTFSLLLGARFADATSIIPHACQDKMYEMFAAVRPGHYLADWIPILDYLPDMLAPWRAKAQRSLDRLMEFWGVFYCSMEARVRQGNAPDCFVKDFLQSPEIETFDEIERRMLISGLLAAGAETTATTLQWFFKATLLNPGAVKEAQKELDSVIGRDRLPEWEDRSSLPEKDTYRGKDVPANTTVIYNTWSIHHNDMYYREHENFIPERFLSEKDDRHRPKYAFAQRHYNFGVGRRECPGQHVAETSLFIIISRLLWAFDFVGPRPSNGTGTAGQVPIIAPAEFECTVAPRDQSTRERISKFANFRDPSLEDAKRYEDDVARIVAKHKAQ